MKNMILFFIIIQLGTVFGQDKKIVAIKIDTIHLQATTFNGYDSFGAYYYKYGTVFKKKFKSKTWEYKNDALGKITCVNIQNPLKIILFYENFNSVVLLDNQLNEIQKINFSEKQTPILASAIGLASGNRLWVYNGLTQQIGLYDYLKSDFINLTLPFPEKINYYYSDFNTFHWINTSNNWYRCDVYGKVTFVKKISDYEQIQFVSTTDFIYKKNNSLLYYTLNGDITTLIDFDEKTFESFSYKDQILSIFTKHGITNYKILLP